MDTNERRIEEFKQEVAELKLRTPDDGNERSWLIAGIVLPLLGLVAILVGWWGASGTSNAADQFPFLLSGGILGLGLILIGAALFVRYSMTRYLRFWLVRLIYEDRSQTDRVVETLERIEAQLRTSRDRDAAGQQ
jgi:hypothetical protein